MNGISSLDLLIEFGRNVAFLVALTLAHSLFRPSIRRLPESIQPVVEGVFFGLSALAVMLTPIMLAPGVRLDGRLVMLAIAGAFGGWKAALVAAAIVIVFRISLGGVGVPPAIGAAITNGAFGSFLFWRCGGAISWYTGRRLILLGVAVAIQQLAWTLTLPPDIAGFMFQVTIVPVIVLFPLVTFLLGTLLVRDQHRINVEAGLSAERTLLRTLIDALPHYVFVKDAAGRFVVSNVAHTQAVQASNPDGLIGKTASDVFPSELAAQFAADDQKVMRSGEPLISQEQRTIDAAGNPIWVVTTKVPLRDNNQQIIGLVGISRDITKSKVAEDALRESEERYRVLFDQIDDAIFIHDRESNILDVNQTACDRLGYSWEELLRMKTIDIDAPDYGSKFYERLERQLGEGKLHDISGVHVMKDGRQVPVHINSRAITFKGQVAVLAVARDVTELRRADQQALELATERARVKVLSDFVRDISHDFRTPLTTISSTAYLLFRSPDPDKRQRHFDTIEGQVKQMTHQIERLLLMARLDGGGAFDLQAVKVNMLLQNIHARFAPVAQERGIQLAVEIPDTLPVIHAEEQEMAQALGEIVDNAITFTPNGGKVTLRGDVSENIFVITVQDTGQGIQPVDVPHIFKRLYRADAARSAERGAAGLGLSIAEKIIEGHHGRIEVISVVGVGSIFRVILPVAP